MAHFDYRREDLVEALWLTGLREGDAAFSHTSVGMLGRPAEGLTRETLRDIFLSAFTEVLGPDGTWVLPELCTLDVAGRGLRPRRHRAGEHGPAL